MKLKLFQPIKPWRITQKFGENLIPLYKQMGLKGHNGIDLSAKNGQYLYAAHDGVITFTGEDGAGGLGVVIRSEQAYEWEDNGVKGESLIKSIYWHIKTGSFKVKPGDKVKAGDVLAEADNTGASTATHLHFGIKPVAQGEQEWLWDNIMQKNGYNGAIDPEPYIIGVLPKQFKFTFTKSMTVGHRNADIMKLQLLLQQLGYFPKDQEPTGYYGNITRQAVFSFQVDFNVASWAELYSLRGTLCGPKTLLALNNI